MLFILKAGPFNDSWDLLPSFRLDDHFNHVIRPSSGLLAELSDYI
jgi:hypothetical protein